MQRKRKTRKCGLHQDSRHANSLHQIQHQGVGGQVHAIGRSGDCGRNFLGSLDLSQFQESGVLRQGFTNQLSRAGLTLGAHNRGFLILQGLHSSTHKTYSTAGSMSFHLREMERPEVEARKQQQYADISAEICSTHETAYTAAFHHQRHTSSSHTSSMHGALKELHATASTAALHHQCTNHHTAFSFKNVSQHPSQHAHITENTYPYLLMLMITQGHSDSTKARSRSKAQPQNTYMSVHGRAETNCTGWGKGSHNEKHDTGSKQIPFPYRKAPYLLHNKASTLGILLGCVWGGKNTNHKGVSRTSVHCRPHRSGIRMSPSTQDIRVTNQLAWPPQLQCIPSRSQYGSG